MMKILFLKNLSLNSFFLFFFLLVRPPRSQRLLIMVWCSSKTEHRLRLPLDSGPIFRLAIFTIRRGSLVPPSFYPTPESPGFPVPCSSPVSSLSFSSSPSVSFSRPPPPLLPSPAAFNSPTSVLRWPPPVDATNQTARSRMGVLAPRVLGVSPPYAVGGTWLWCGFGGGVEDGAPPRLSLRSVLSNW